MSVEREERNKLISSLRQIAREDGRYEVMAFQFLFEALAHTQQLFKKDIQSEDEEARHVTGQELCEGARQLALEQFGYMAKAVFEGWGIYSTDDFGEIVYLLIRHRLMAKRGSDSVEDFHDIYDFDSAFENVFAFDRGDPKKARREPGV